jgi:hypothetical protein
MRYQREQYGYMKVYKVEKDAITVLHSLGKDFEFAYIKRFKRAQLRKVK